MRQRWNRESAVIKQRTFWKPNPPAFDVCQVFIRPVNIILNSFNASWLDFVVWICPCVSSLRKICDIWIQQVKYNVTVNTSIDVLFWSLFNLKAEEHCHISFLLCVAMLPGWLFYKCLLLSWTALVVKHLTAEYKVPLLFPMTRQFKDLKTILPNEVEHYTVRSNPNLYLYKPQGKVSLHSNITLIRNCWTCRSETIGKNILLFGLQKEAFHINCGPGCRDLVTIEPQEI